MNTERERRRSEILQEAAELPLKERASYVAEACGDDPLLLDAVERTLEMEPSVSPSLLDIRPSDTTDAGDSQEPDLLGTKIGTIHLIDVLGKGGMGQVYLGHDEKLKRKVAVKCILAEHLNADVKARFLQEARILSRLKHPGICQIHDYIEGEKNDFLVLELIEGQTLRQAMEDGLDERAKMRIALELADVLVAGHAQNVVHRDLKPGNVMLTPEGEVKVLDFGLARALDDPQTIRPVATSGDEPRDSTIELAKALGSLKTQTGLIMGTPEYMSPEQASSEAVTPASDMYSFGLILHRLFTGQPPYGSDLKIYELIRKAAAAETQPIEGVDKDLAALIERLTSLAPGSRPSASDTGERLRAIRDAPARRRIRHLKIAAVAALALIAAMMTFQAFRISQEADRARQEAATTQQVLELFVSLFEVSDPGEARGQEITAREILDRGAKRISRGLDDQPKIRARLLDSIGVIYTKLGLLKDSEPLLEEALAARRSTPGGEELPVAESLGNLAFLRMGQGRFEEADQLSTEALEIRERAHGTDHEDVAESLHLRGQLFAQQGKFESAEPLLQRAIEIQERTLGDDSEEVARSLADLALLYEQQGRFDDAEQSHQRAVSIREELGPDHPELAESLNGLAIVYDQRGDHELARPLWERALDISERVLEPGHPFIASMQTNLAAVRVKLGELDGVEALYQQALLSFENMFGAEHPSVGDVQANMANLHLRRGQYAEAETLFRRAHSIFEQALGSEHPATGMTLGSVGQTYLARRRYVEAEPYYQRALTIFEQTFGTEHPEVARTLNFLTMLYAQTGRIEEAQNMSKRARAIAERALGPDHHDTAIYLANFGDLERRRGALEEAEAHLLRAIATLEALLGPDDPKLKLALRSLANVYRDQGEIDRAEPLYVRCAKVLETAHGRDHPAFTELYEDHAELLRAAGRGAEASRLEKRARDLAQTFGLADRPRG